jgi:hypothetical protein
MVGASKSAAAAVAALDQAASLDCIDAKDAALADEPEHHGSRPASLPGYAATPSYGRTKPGTLRAHARLNPVLLAVASEMQLINSLPLFESAPLRGKPSYDAHRSKTLNRFDRQSGSKSA